MSNVVSCLHGAEKDYTLEPNETIAFHALLANSPLETGEYYVTANLYGNFNPVILEDAIWYNFFGRVNKHFNAASLDYDLSRVIL